LRAAVTDETGTGSLVFATSPTLVTPALGTPSALVGTNITGTAAGLTAGNVTTNANLTGAITSVGNAASLGSFTSANLAAALTDETGTGANVFATSPTLTTPALGTPSALVGTNITGTASGLTAGNVTTNANLTGDVTSVGNATSIAAGVIVNADINASAGIVDTKLATISTASKVSNSATTATSANTANAIVARDASGNFTAGTITAALTGTASGNLVSGGALGTPSSGTLTNCTFPTLNQNTTGSAATLTTGRTIAITGDLAYTSPSFNGSGNVTAAGTLATVNANVGSFTVASITVNAKGLITAASSGSAPAPTTAQVLSATAGANVGEVGTYAFCNDTTNSNSNLAAGSTIAGSSLRYGNVHLDRDGILSIGNYSGTPSGTWRIMGYGQRGPSGTYNDRYVSLFLRIS
jgi:hypothetical protein